MGTSLNKTESLYLKNNSNQTVTKGDCVILDKTLAGSFTLTGSVQFGISQMGVVLDQTNVANGTSCLVAIGGYVPVINLLSGANVGDTFGLSSVVKKSMPHSSYLPGDFGQVLSAGTTPDAFLWGGPPSIPADFVYTYFTGTADINLGLTGTNSTYVDVNANTQILFTPQSPGKYRVVFTFNHYMFPSSAAASIDIFFRITDGTTNSRPVESYCRVSATNEDRQNVITLGCIFTWNDTTQRTIKLQKNSSTAGTITTHVLGVSGVGGASFIMEVFRIGS